MQHINAVSIAPYSKDWMADTHHARILHVFDHACNLINERGEVLSIVATQIGNGPFNLVIEDDVLFYHTLSNQSPVSFSTTQLNIGNITIHTVDAKLWHPRPGWAALHEKRDDILNQLMSLPITNYQQLSGFDMPFDDHSELFNHQHLPIVSISNSLISSLTSAFATADISSARTITSKLAGLGTGLTPAGDDFIMGAIYAAWIIHPLEAATVLASEIAETAAALTTSLSAAWLRSAGRGEAGILWHNFFEELTSANPVQILEARDKILAVGETSGADALAGFSGVFMSWMVYKK